MAYLVEIFWAALMAGVPVGVFTFVLLWWALSHGHFQEPADSRALEREMKNMAKRAKDKNAKNQKSQHPVQKKWAKFGGGFYGVVAFLTYIVIEVIDIATTIINYGGFFDFLKSLNFGLIINMFIEALTNFIAAMVWPLYWMRQVETNQVWIWFVVAYAGYWLGMKQAIAVYQRRKAAGSP